MEKEKCYLESLNKEKCTGCGACVAICPKKCIKLVEDAEGFKYPTIDNNKCINCNLCKRNCPVINNPSNKKLDNEIVYIYRTKNESKLLEASSGGAFEDICVSYLKNKDNIAIFGATLTKEKKVCHTFVDSIKKINKFKKSKYVQSDTKESYINTKELLLKGNYVVFSGTPCQISGLKKYLKKEYDNLLCIDIVCHGVPSQKVLDLYIEHEEKKKNSKINSLNFREKIKKENGEYDSKTIKLNFEDDVIIKNSEDSAFLKGYNSRLFNRPSCYKCVFASEKRFSDITISDAWGMEKSSKDFHKGLSSIVVHTQKGMEVVSKLDGDFYDQKDIQFMIKNNSAYNKPALYNPNRDNFFKDLSADNFAEKVRKNYKFPIIMRIKRKIWNIIKNTINR